MNTEIYTIGHSSRSIDEFVNMLRDAQVTRIADVRTFPRSRTNPQFNIDILPDRLSAFRIGYDHYPALGGRRARQENIDPQENAMWRVASFHNYADYALGESFGKALDALLLETTRSRVAIMCAEAVWWRCHRRIICDYLLLNGYSVKHLMAPARIDKASPTPGARRRRDGKILYPPEP